MTKSPRQVPNEPLSMLFYRYSDGGIGRTAWIEGHIADHLCAKFKKKQRGGQPIYVIRCKPRETPLCPIPDASTSTPELPSRSENGCTG